MESNQVISICIGILESSQAISIIESNLTEVQLRKSPLSFWRDENGYLRVINETQGDQSSPLKMLYKARHQHRVKVRLMTI